MKDLKHYAPAGLTVFFTVAAILLFYDTLFGSRTIVTFGEKLTGILTPILYGAMIAYLLAPVINFIERHWMSKAIQKAKSAGQFCAVRCRMIALILVWILVFVCAYLLLSFLLPDLSNSIIQLANNLETYYNTVYGWINKLLEQYPELEIWVSDQLNASYQDLLTWVGNTVMPQAKEWMTSALSLLSGSIINVVNFAKNLIIGIIVATYLMATKEQSAAGCRRLTCAILPRNQATWLFKGVARADSIFSGFVRGKLLDSLIIGILCFFGCSILNMPYTPLVSVFVGVTNIIPFFGPFLGAIPSLFLILLASPIKALYFLIFVVALQQLDGNVIGPKILGNKTGLSSFWVIVAILVGGGFFGVIGMFFGVPVFACIQTLIRFLTNIRLNAKQLPLEPISYRQSAPPPSKEKAPKA